MWRGDVRELGNVREVGELGSVDVGVLKSFGGVREVKRTLDVESVGQCWRHWGVGK